MQGLLDTQVDFPQSITGQEAIHSQPSIPCSTILLGRSGTGKTTVLLFRMFHMWHQHHINPEAAPYNMVRIRPTHIPMETLSLVNLFDRLQASCKQALKNSACGTMLCLAG